MVSLDQRLNLRAGYVWTDGVQRYEIVGTRLREGALRYIVRTDDEEYADLSMEVIVPEVLEAEWSTSSELKQLTDLDFFIAGLDPDERIELLNTEADIREVNTGYRSPLGAQAGKPATKYDPARTSKTKRVKRKARERGIAESAMWDLLRRYKEAGRRALIHGNRVLGEDKLARLDPELVYAARRWVQAHAVGSTKINMNLIAMLLADLEGQGFSITVNRARTLLRELTRGKSLNGPANNRKSKESRPSSGGSWDTVLPGEIWEIDCTPCDFFVYSPVGKAYVRPYAIGITDVGSKQSSLLLTVDPPSARTVGIALFRRVNPTPPPPLHRPWLSGPSIPEELRIEEGCLELEALSGGIAAEIHMDHGPEYENAHIFGICAALGMDVVLTRQRTGSDKPHVEGLVGLLNRFAQLLPGHTGRSPDHRGDKPHNEPLVDLAVFQALADELCHLHAFQPHSGLVHPLRPNERLAPIQVIRQARLQDAPLRITPHVNLIYEFLPTVRGVVDGGSVQVNTLRYTCERIRELEELSAGDAKNPSRALTFHRDPMDISRLFWHKPGTWHWIVLRAVGGPGDDYLPALSEQFLTAVIEEMSRTIPSVTQQVLTRKLLYQGIKELARSKRAGQEKLYREFLRLREAVPDPKPYRGQTPVAAAAPDLADLLEFAEFEPDSDDHELTDDELLDALTLREDDFTDEGSYWEDRDNADFPVEEGIA